LHDEARIVRKSLFIAEDIEISEYARVGVELHLSPALYFRANDIKTQDFKAGRAPNALDDWLDFLAPTNSLRYCRR
jgi:hypothetical protein